MNHDSLLSLLLQSNFTAALAAYERALLASEQREIRLLCLHEVGWSQLLLLRWEKAAQAFLRLKSDSRWSKIFYGYLSAGSLGNGFCLCISGALKSCPATCQVPNELVAR